MVSVASISDRVGDLGAYLREQRESAKLSVRQLASLAGVSNPYLSQVERGLRRPSAEVLQQLAKGLRISAEALYVRAGILDDGPRGTVEAAVEADEGLNPRQKKVLLELCAHFRSENVRADTTPDETSPDETSPDETSPDETSPDGTSPDQPVPTAPSSSAATPTAATPRSATPPAVTPAAATPNARPENETAPSSR
jgi:transcriptional regulator with XRE-family HTH domain